MPAFHGDSMQALILFSTLVLTGANGLGTNLPQDLAGLNQEIEGIYEQAATQTRQTIEERFGPLEKGEFETQAAYKQRMDKSEAGRAQIQDELLQQVWVRYRQLSEARDTWLQTTAFQPTNGKFQLGRYDADRQWFEMSRGRSQYLLPVTISSAPHFKEEFSEANFKVAGTLQPDGQVHESGVRVQVLGQNFDAIPVKVSPRSIARWERGEHKYDVLYQSPADLPFLIAVKNGKPFVIDKLTMAKIVGLPQLPDVERVYVSTLADGLALFSLGQTDKPYDRQALKVLVGESIRVNTMIFSLPKLEYLPPWNQIEVRHSPDGNQTVASWQTERLHYLTFEKPGTPPREGSFPCGRFGCGAGTLQWFNDGFYSAEIGKGEAILRPLARKGKSIRLRWPKKYSASPFAQFYAAAGYFGVLSPDSAESQNILFRPDRSVVEGLSGTRPGRVSVRLSHDARFLAFYAEKPLFDLTVFEVETGLKVAEEKASHFAGIVPCAAARCVQVTFVPLVLNATSEARVYGTAVAGFAGPPASSVYGPAWAFLYRHHLLGFSQFDQQLYSILIPDYSTELMNSAVSVALTKSDGAGNNSDRNRGAGATTPPVTSATQKSAPPRTHCDGTLLAGRWIPRFLPPATSSWNDFQAEVSIEPGGTGARRAIYKPNPKLRMKSKLRVVVTPVEGAHCRIQFTDEQVEATPDPSKYCRLQFDLILDESGNRMTGKAVDPRNAANCTAKVELVREAR
jgi:hypothetical protein